MAIRNSRQFLNNAYLLHVFFASLPDWRLVSGAYGITSTLSQQDYDDLFKGTDADLYIPLWASACKGKGDILLDRTTYECICFYKAHGYQPVLIDGNPADYIGEQLRFLEYLSVCGLNGELDAEPVIGEFIQKFTIDTVNILCKSIEEQTSVKLTEELQTVVSALRALVQGSPLTLADDGYCNDMGCLSWHLGDPLPVEEPHIVRSAGVNNCGGNCKLEVWTAEGCIMDISSDTTMNGLQIRACPRGRGYRRTYLSGRNRLRYPMRRRADRGEGKYERITYEEAAEMIAAKMQETLENYGPSSRYTLYGTGVCAVTQPYKFMRRLLAMQGGYLSYYNSYSSAQTNYISNYILGTENTCNNPLNFLKAKLILLWGYNAAETIMGPFSNYYLTKAKEQGTRIIVIDPRESESAVTYADAWIGLRPGSDLALANAMAYVIFRDGLQDQAFLDAFCIGHDESHMPEGIPAGESYKSYLFGEKDGIVKDPTWAEKITGIPADTIEQLAKEYAAAKPACLMTGLGLQRTFNGENTTRATVALAAMTGNIGKEGGAAGATVVMPGHTEPPYVYEQPKNPCNIVIPTFLWTKAIEKWKTMTAEEDGIKGASSLPCGIKLIFSLASNTLINQHADINDTKRILSDTNACEMIVASDVFHTPSTRWADILLPAPSLFETENMPTVWEGGDYQLYGNQCIPPLFDCRYEYDWIKLVADELGLYDEFVDGCPEKRDWHRRIYENDLMPYEPELPDFSTFMKEGGHVYSTPGGEPVPFRKQVEDGEPFHTPSGKIEIFCERLFDMHSEEIGGVPVWFDGPEGPTDYERMQTYPLQLIGYHTKRRCHSIHDTNPWMEQLDPPALWMHPEDAAKRNIHNGDMIEVFNDRGTVRIPALVTDRIAKGACALSQGGWYTPDENGVDTRGSINVLTSTYKPSPVANGNPQHTNLVEVRLCGQP